MNQTGHSAAGDPQTDHSHPDHALPEQHVGVLSFGEKIGYGLGDAACNFYWKMFEFYLLYFYTDVFGLPVASVATLFLVTRIADALSDPLVGFLSDRTQTRWGRFRPYLLWGPVPLAIAAVAMFSSPDLSDGWKLVYAYVTYLIAMFCYTLVNAPYSALMGVMSPNSIERTSLTTYRFVFAFSGALAVHYLTLDLVHWFGGSSADPTWVGEREPQSNEAVGFFWTVVLYASASLVLFWTSFLCTRERVALPMKEQRTNEPATSAVATSSFRQDVADLLSNSAWMCLFFFGLPLMLGGFIRNGVALFYLKYYCDRADLAPSFFIAGTLSAMVSILTTKTMAVGIGKRNTVLIGCLINAAATSCFYFLRPDDLTAIFILQIISAMTVGPVAVLLWSMYADAADYSHWKNQRRATGLVFSAATFAQKVGASIGAALAALLLSYFLYQSPIDGVDQVQSDQTKAGLRMMMSLIPASFFLLAAFSIMFYPLDDQKMRTIEADIRKRKVAT